MPQCENISNCRFFHEVLPKMQGMAALYQRKYCTEKPDECARRAVLTAKGPTAVPANLFPNQHDRAKAIIETGSDLPSSSS